MPLTSRVSPKGAVFVPIPSTPKYSNACTSEDIEIRAIVAAALVDGVPTSRPPSETDSPLFEVNNGKKKGLHDWMDDELTCPTMSTKALFRALVAGFVMSVFSLAFQPLRFVNSGEQFPWLHYANTALLALLFTGIVWACEAALGPCCITGVGFGASPCNNHSLPLRRLIDRAVQTMLGNTAGAVFGATTTAVLVHKTADAGFVLASEIMGAAVDSARAIADARPPLIFLSAVAAAFVLTAAMSSGIGSETHLSLSTSSTTFSYSSFRRYGCLFIACLVVAVTECHVGIADKSFVSATAAFNAMEPLGRPLGPNVFNYLFAIVGNLLGAALAGATSDLLRTLICRNAAGDKEASKTVTTV